MLALLTEVENSLFKVYRSRWAAFILSIILFIFERASLPKLMSKLRISAFSERFVFSVLIILDWRVAGANEPSGIEAKVVLMLSVRVYLNFSYSFLRAASFMSSLVYYSFCFFNSSLSSSSVFSLCLITPLSRFCSSLALVRSPCKISVIFRFLFF